MDRYFPNTVAIPDPTSLATASGDALQIARRYESSPRFEHGFLCGFFLLQQLVTTADPDGTIEAARGKVGRARARRDVNRSKRRVSGKHLPACFGAGPP